jgi:hypothetical protein
MNAQIAFFFGRCANQVVLDGPQLFLLLKTFVCLKQSATAKKPVHAAFDRENSQDVKSHQEHKREFNVGTKRIG